MYHQQLQQQQQHQHQQQQQQYQQYQQRQLQLQQEQKYRLEQERLSPSSHAARDYDIQRKLSAKQRDHKPKLQHQHSLTGSPGTVKQRVKERKHTMKDAEVIAKLRTICTESDPTLIYRNMRKIGQG